MTPRLLERYRETIIPKLKEEFSYSNAHQVPTMTKIVVNMGLGEAAANPKLIENAASELALITGQKPVVRKARKSVANFKLREGQSIGCSVTLRGVRMWEFFDRLMNVSLPRVRDFKGLSPKAFDGRGNYSLGVREQIIFPEVDYDKIEHVTGMNVTICTTARNDKEGRSLLTHLGVPFRQ
ncbi:MAG: 50S ribosomal protein L5 [Deltaproteobacteria bacterium]|jgi:large subunit ribosomal protein L5|nr:50S ribosomal protein L5 [Deltaproteobacteria bacterium]